MMLLNGSLDRGNLGKRVHRSGGVGEVYANPHEGFLRQALEAYNQHSPQVRVLR